MQKVLIIIGPTASGKSSLAVELAKKFNGEVISADSRQVYRGMNIGSGKVTKREMAGVPHHLLDVASPKKVFNAADFVRLGRQAIVDITSRGKLPIICGGTGFYIDTLLGRITLPEVPPNPTLRKRLEKLPTEKLFAKLQKLDPARAWTIDSQNPIRLVRAIEIATALGSVPKPTKDGPLYDTLWIGIEWPKEKLHQRIHERLLARMKVRMVAEAKRLHAAGLSYKRMEEMGLEYRYLARLLRGTLSKAEFLTQLETAIRGYARAQMHYWRRNKEITWLPANKLLTATILTKKFLK